MTEALVKSDILLIGGGHSHVGVLADWAKNGLPAPNATLLTPEPTLRYSGMVPGWISGEYARDAGVVDLAGLARAAGARLVLDRCVALDPFARSVLTQSHGLLPFDIASVDVGGVGRAARVLGDDPRLIDVRPIIRFVDRLAETLAQPLVRPLRIVVIGGGAGGFEIAFALRNAKGRNVGGVTNPPQVTLITGADGPLPDLSPGVASRATKEFDAQGMAMITGDASFVQGELCVEGAPVEPPDIIIAAIGSGAPDWPRAGGLDVDKAGFIMVDRFQRSTSHRNIFAAGDCAARMDCEVPHSGVHAVHTGPVLAANLRKAASGEEPAQSYRPRPASLYLLSTGNGSAIASYGRFAAQGRWAAQLKRWIDKRWLASYASISDRA